MRHILRQFGIAFLTISMVVSPVVSPVVAGIAKSCSCSSGASSCCDTTISCCMSTGPLSKQSSCCSSKIKLTTTSSCCQQTLFQADRGSSSEDPCDTCRSCQGTTSPEQSPLQIQQDETLQQLALMSELPSLDIVSTDGRHLNFESSRPITERPVRVLFSVWLN